LEQIDQVTQQNTGNAEQGAAAAEELDQQAAALQQLLSHFQLHETATSESSALYEADNNQKAISQ